VTGDTLDVNEGSAGGDEAALVLVTKVNAASAVSVHRSSGRRTHRSR
jgi:hypothetical protein